MLRLAIYHDEDVDDEDNGEDDDADDSNSGGDDDGCSYHRLLHMLRQNCFASWKSVLSRIVSMITATCGSGTPPSECICRFVA